MSKKDFCPTCNAAGIAPCVTASGKPTKRHKARVTVDLTPVTETQKERFDRLKAENRVEKAKPESLIGTPDEFRPKATRERRRAFGNHRHAGRGRRRRAQVSAVNNLIRNFWKPKKKVSESDVKEPVSA